MSTRANQKGASAGGDVVGRDKLETHYHGSRPSVVERLLQKLQAEIEKNAEVRHTIEALARFQSGRPRDSVQGLEAKLIAGGRANERTDALEKKELFAKLLERWSLYASAQEIFAFLLAKAEYEFTYFILPQISNLNMVEINQLVNDRIVAPTVMECGATVFMVDHATAMGMIYWLAEQCFVRWHQ